MMKWSYRHCGDCGEETALLLDIGGDRSACMACYSDRFGARPDAGEIVWQGAPSAMVDYWIGG